MLNKYRRLNVWMCVLTILTTLSLTGCQATESFYRGYTAVNDSIAPLKSPGLQKGSWKAFDLSLNYQYQLTGEILDISGVITFGLYHELNTGRFQSLDIYLFFLDNTSKVMETAIISRALGARPEDEELFAKKLKVPDGAASIAFGYKGIAQDDGGGIDPDEGGGGGGGQHYFNDLPKRPK